jgi:hypothetical protein
LLVPDRNLDAEGRASHTSSMPENIKTWKCLRRRVSSGQITRYQQRRRLITQFLTSAFGGHGCAFVFRDRHGDLIKRRWWYTLVEVEDI